MDYPDIDKKVLVQILNGFIRSVLSSMETMVFTQAKRVDIYLKDTKKPMEGDISGIISLFGDLNGTCAISFPRALAVKLISKMLMDDTLDDINDDVKDGIGEIVNLTAGGAKSDINSILGTDTKITTPTIITGINHSVEHQDKIPCIGCVFEAEGMKFFMEIAVYTDKK